MKLASADHLQKRFQRERLRLDDFVRVEIRFAGGKAGGREGNHGFFDESGTGIDVHHFAKMLCTVAGLLGKFALGGFQIIFAALFAASDYFEHVISGRLPVLTNHKDAAVIQNRKHDDGAGMSDDVTAGGLASGFDNDVMPHAKNFSLINHFAGNKFDAAFGHDASTKLRINLSRNCNREFAGEEFVAIERVCGCAYTVFATKLRAQL
jgi:hypothetical protein